MITRCIYPAIWEGDLLVAQKAKKTIHWHGVRFEARSVHVMHVIQLGEKNRDH